MRSSDIAIMKKVLDVLEKYLPPDEKALLDEYSGVFERFNAKNDKEKSAYKNRAEYHREYSRSWKEQNPEKQKQYDRSWKEKNPEKQKKYQEKYYQEKTKEKRLQKAKAETNKKPSLIDKLQEKRELAKGQASESDAVDKELPRKSNENR